MLGHRPLTLEDYGTILKRRWWLIAIPAAILPIIAYAVTFFVTPQYVSQTLVLVEQQKVPESYVKPVITEDLDSRLATMKEQIMSRSRLAPIIDRFNLYANKGLSMDDRVDRARKAIGITPIQSSITRGLPGFYISFTASDPRTAQLVCGEITSLFVSENLHARAASAEGTTEFLKGQLDDAKAKLDEQAAKLAKFQQEYAGRLPDEQSTNLSMTSTLSTQLDATTQALTRMEQDKSYAEAILSQQVAAQNAQLTDHGPAPQAQQAQLEQLENQEAQLLTTYTEDYPDVIAVKRKIKELQAAMAKGPAPAKATASTAPSRNDSPGVLQLRAQIHAMDIGIAQKKAEQARIQGQLRMYQDRISASPAVQEQYKSITRDTQTAQQFYDDLLAKMNQSQMGTDLERRQQGEQFTVMDEPNLPESPTFPKRGVFVAGGLAGGLALGLLLTGLLEYKDTSMRSERDIWAFTKLPTLAVIEFSPELDHASPRRRWFSRRKPDMTADKPLVKVGG
ncbi:GumC family protein [Edaphobacter sp.]|uniref:GumC family protein n=1 Tax=Edaphobacter sp. TaxID=1934404 RepID=UPI002DBD53A6|nr:Wzz/FepE/Etk N-terminal domain-containing protein [Edaphobacter sp.]HEU5339634.1 Wzz/FepE/Etk N-terminal domain-containing protein [Edaphobacter sp.]